MEIIMESGSNTAASRLEWIDLVRVFAIFLVVLCHAIEGGVYNFNIYVFADMNIFSKIFGFASFTFSRLASCLFLIMSGYLLLDRSYDKDKILRFWKKSWLHLLICTVIWFLVYDIILMNYYHWEKSFLTILYDLIFFHEVKMMNAWYMPAILGIYVLVPFVAIALKQLDKDLLKFPVIFFLILIFAFPMIEIVNSMAGGPELSLQLSLGFSGGMYCFYMMCGYLVKRGVFKPVKTGWLIAVIVCCIALGTVMQLFAFSRGVQYTIWRDNPLILLASVALFEAFSRIREVKHAKFIKELASYSFAVYLVHVIIRLLLLNFILSLPIIRPVKVIIFWLITLILSYLVSWLISRIPKAGNYLIYRK